MIAIFAELAATTSGVNLPSISSLVRSVILENPWVRYAFSMIGLRQSVARGGDKALCRSQILFQVNTFHQKDCEANSSNFSPCGTEHGLATPCGTVGHSPYPLLLPRRLLR